MPGSRIFDTKLRSKIMSSQEVAALIPAGASIGMSGFTGSGYPKDVPLALAQRITELHQGGEAFKVEVWTGASTAPELDGALTRSEGVELRLPYQSDPTTRAAINSGQVEYTDLHLSHVPQFVRFGFLGKLHVVIVEVTSILEGGRLVPSTSVGNNKTWLDEAEHIILEVNEWQNAKLEGMHDIFYRSHNPPHRWPIPILKPDDRIGTPYLLFQPKKVLGIVETNAPDRNTPFSLPDESSRRIAGHLLEFFEHEIKKGRLPPDLLPLQSGVGNIANAVLAGLQEGPYQNLSAYTEVLQDGMLEMLKSGKLRSASATALSLSPAALDDFNRQIDDYRGRIILRSQGISNHPEVIRRLGCLSMNGMIEADIYGNVNSTHVMGTSIMNGIGGSGDFARNAYISIFMAPSTAKKGAISTLVPMVSHVDHTEHDVHVIVTEQGLADLRGHSPKQRARLIIDHCAHPDFRPALRDYFQRALLLSPGKQTPHLLDEAFAWHRRYLRGGTMHEPAQGRKGGDR